MYKRTRDLRTSTSTGTSTNPNNAAPEVVWAVEPHVALAVMIEMLNASGVTVVTSAALQSVRMRDRKVLSMLDLKQRNFSAAIFVDCSYEGDLMAAAGISFAIGKPAARGIPALQWVACATRKEATKQSPPSLRLVCVECQHPCEQPACVYTCADARGYMVLLMD